jgi:glycosyltransferase involved in cell wall biosynthesis
MDASPDFNQDSSRKLLIITESLGIGGTESHLIRTLPPLVEAGWSVATFCLTERGERADKIEGAGVKVFSPPRIARQKGSFFRYPAHVAVAVHKLYWLMRVWRPQIAHFYLPGPYIIGSHVAMAARTPIKVMSRRSLSGYQQNWPTVARFERRLHARMDAVIGNSRAVVGELIDEGVSADRVRLIYNGIPSLSLPARADARAALGLDDKMLVGIVIANIIHYKGHRELVRGLSHVAARLTQPWCILVAGRDHGLRAELEGLAEARGISQHIRFIGEYAQIPQLLAAADFGLLTSREEGFSNVVLEAMSAGLPMIVTNVGGNPEAIIDGESGRVVPPCDPVAIGKAILQLATDRELRTRLGTAARRRVEKEFSIERCVQKHAALYEELLQRSRGGALPLAAE